MVVVGIIGAVLIAIGIFLFIFLGSIRAWGNTAMWVSILIALASILGGGSLIAATVSWEIIRIKIVGLVLVLFGVFMFGYFPGISQIYPSRYQPMAMGRFGMFLGLVSLLVGIYLLVFF